MESKWQAVIKRTNAIRIYWVATLPRAMEICEGLENINWSYYN